MVIRVWLPAIRGGSGVDIQTRRLALELQRHGVGAEISWFPTYYQLAPFVLSRVPPPPGTNLVHGLSWSAFAFSRPGLPLVVTEQLDILDPLYRPYKSVPQSFFHHACVRRFMKRSFAMATIVTAVSHATAASLAQTVDLNSAQVIPNCVDTQIFRPQTDVPGPSKRFRLLFVGNLTKRKGADLLAPIMKRLGRGFELRFTSGLRDGSLKDIAENMIPIGKLNTDQELVAAYHHCDALLFPSRLEGLPIAPLEAMACAKPVIAAAVSSLPEVVDNRVTGILCERDNIAQFVSACQLLADSPQTLRQYAAAARDRTEALFSNKVVVPQYIGLYEKALNTKKS